MGLKFKRIKLGQGLTGQRDSAATMRLSVECGAAPGTVATDHDLMLAVAAGDEQAFGLLLQRHLAGMVALAQRILSNSADADEVAQEAFLRLWTQAVRWDASGAAQPRTWLSRVVTNLCIDRCRKKPTLPLEYADDVADGGMDGFGAVQDADKRTILQQSLQRLPVNQRTAVVLSYYEELSGKEIAELMALTPGAVESLLVRARRALRQDLERLQLLQGRDL